MDTDNLKFCDILLYRNHSLQKMFFLTIVLLPNNME